MLSYLSRARQGFAILLAYDLPAVLALSFVFIFFREQGYSLWWLILMYVIYSALSLLITCSIKTFFLRSFLLASFVGYSLVALLLLLNPPYAPVFYGALISFPSIFFWIPLNYIFFRNSARETHAVDSTLFMVLPGMASIVMPPLGALVIEKLGYEVLFGMAAILFLVPLFWIRKNIPEERLTAVLAPGMTEYRGLRTITFLEGSLHYFTGVIIPVYALLFFREASAVGWFLSYLAVISLIIALAVSRRSDHTLQRKSYLFIMFAALTLSLIPLALAKTTPALLVAIGLFTLIYTVSSPLRLAVSLDVKKVDMGFWKAREIFLSAGRVATLSASTLFFYYELYWPVFLMFGIIAAAYPFLISHKLKEIH